jgi:hypothetical protein
MDLEISYETTLGGILKQKMFSPESIVLKLPLLIGF